MIAVIVALVLGVTVGYCVWKGRHDTASELSQADDAAAVTIVPVQERVAAEVS